MCNAHNCGFAKRSPRVNGERGVGLVSGRGRVGLVE